ncbi:hypothetical protein [Argonema antarcticum]|uniref:hypothetical protein n=1 Tax=Argonema antarcticum TaxID=2942763 RepID=UPI0020122137|nr:hypothetical protein [Argonema antarcticum]MCL1473381.1 hypothetical protein [Argonema antarcticum A004/B2]
MQADEVNLLRDAFGSEKDPRSYLAAGLYGAGSAILGIISVQLSIILGRSVK